MSQPTKTFNVVPHVKIKRELSSSSDEESIPCRLCSKEFASEAALRNHARVEHTDAFLREPDNWAPQPQPPPVKKEPRPQPVSPSCSLERVIRQREQAILSSMRPSSLQALAAHDVEYIIVKADKEPTKTKKRKAERSEGDRRPETGHKKEREEKTREQQVIAGPFECLQPSNLVADGTCHQIFFSCCEYSAHFRDEHTRRRKGNRCQVCEKPLLSGDGMDAPFNCMVCGAGFMSNKDLANHTTTNHVKLKPFECNVCHKRFTQQGGVQQHMRMHTGVRPFSCTFCPKAFTQKSGLDQHLRIHTKVKPYRCVICSKTFCQSVHLKQHMRTHTNVSPFQCAICAKRFKQSSHLNYHLKNHNPFSMTDEQRAKYEGLMAAMGGAEDQSPKRKVAGKKSNKVVVLTRDNGELIAVSQDELQHYMDSGQILEVAEVEDGVEVLEESEVNLEDQSEQDQQEQLLAEQSIQVEGESYILGDAGGVVWDVEEIAE